MCLPEYMLVFRQAFLLKFNVCSATARTGGSKCTCFPYCCPCARTWHNYFFLCLIFSKKFNILSALFVSNRSPSRKKSILAKVGFDAKGG